MFFLQMAGFPGAGKSTLAKRIAKETGAVIIDHDVVKSALLEALGENPDPKLAGGGSYGIEWSLIDDLLGQGHKVIHDSPCLYDEMVEKGRQLTDKHNVAYKYVECYLNDYKEINRRLKERVSMPSHIQQAKSEESFKVWVEASKKPSDIVYLVVDAAQPVEDYLEKVISYLQE